MLRARVQSVQISGIRLPQHTWPNLGQKIADPMVLLERTSRQNARAVLRHGRTCSEVWRGNLNWQTKKTEQFCAASTMITTSRWIMLNTIFVKNDFTLPTMRVARFSSTRTLSTLTSTSNRRTFMIPGEACKIILLKENRDGFCKAFFHVLHFVADSSCHYVFSRSWLGSRWFQWNSLVMSQPWR